MKQSSETLMMTIDVSGGLLVCFMAFGFMIGRLMDK